jgi:hypothetical protein
MMTKERFDEIAAKAAVLRAKREADKNATNPDYYMEFDSVDDFIEAILRENPEDDQAKLIKKSSKAPPPP